MSASDLHGLELWEVSGRVAARELSPVELTEVMLERIDRLDPELNSFLTVDAEGAVAAARAAEAAIAAGYHLGPLHGIPVALKDIVAARGQPMSGGGRAFGSAAPDRDATVAASMRAAGAIFLGKLNQHEFAYGVTTENPHFGTCLNPWDREHSAGGSSGGPGAAVAARLCYAALGTDTGCSVRLPAAYNGIAGLRPSIGRVSNRGVMALAWTLDTVGPMARSVRDCAIVLQAIAGHDAADPQTSLSPVPGYETELEHPPNPPRIGLIEDFSLTSLDPEVYQAVSGALSAFEKHGASVREVRVPELEHSISALLTVDIAEPSAYHGEAIRQRPSDYGEDLRDLLEAGEIYLATHYIQAQRYRTVVREHLLAALRDVDVIVTPTVHFTVPRIGDREVQIGRAEPEGLIDAIMRFQSLAPLAGLPALSVPCGFTNAGLPIGLQLIGRPFDETTVLQVGSVYQQLTDWHHQFPDI